MVNLSVPADSALSASLGTPQLTINHEVAADLDSTNAFEGPEKLLEVWFAPTATALPTGAHKDGLKAVPSSTWVDMLDLVNCQILSVIQSENMDAYLLSESSMFVFPHKLILKTCGTTTLLLGLQRLLHIAAAKAGFPFHNATLVEDVRAAATPFRVFYSRKNFLFPDKQRGPHRSWKQEVKFLDDMFENGSAYMVGKMNGDHWYLYMTSPSGALTPPQTPDKESVGGTPVVNTKIRTGFLGSMPSGAEEPHDETLEVLMTDLDPEHAKKFYLSHASALANEKAPTQVQEARRAAHDSLGELSADAEGAIFDVEDVDGAAMDAKLDATPATKVIAEAITTEGHALGTVVSDACGLSDVYPTTTFPEARIDAYMFAPCGFSANGVIPAPPANLAALDGSASTATPPSAHYFTVHVTPEPNCSYASFETNVPGGQTGRGTTEIIEHVVRIFRPGRFSVTLFEAKKTARAATVGGGVGDGARKQLERIEGYRRIDRVVHDFEDYDLVFRYYEREGWVSDGSARVGEDI